MPHYGQPAPVPSHRRAHIGLTPGQAVQRLRFWGLPGPHADALRRLVGNVVARLPGDVQRWLLLDVEAVFILGPGPGQYGAAGPLHFRLDAPTERAPGGLLVVRPILLSPAMLDAFTPTECEWIIGHEIAHHYSMTHGTGAEERAADDLVWKWGLGRPPDGFRTPARYERGAPPTSAMVPPRRPWE